MYKKTLVLFLCLALLFPAIANAKKALPQEKENAVLSKIIANYKYPEVVKRFFMSKEEYFRALSTQANEKEFRIAENRYLGELAEKIVVEANIVRDAKRAGITVKNLVSFSEREPAFKISDERYYSALHYFDRLVTSYVIKNYSVPKYYMTNKVRREILEAGLYATILESKYWNSATSNIVRYTTKILTNQGTELERFSTVYHF